MKTDPLNSFLDFNGGGKIDTAESFMGFMMFQEVFKGEADDADEDEDDE